MKLVFEKKINLYERYLKKEGLTELDRLENKMEWILSHQLALDLHKRVVELISRVHLIEEALNLE